MKARNLSTKQHQHYENILKSEAQDNRNMSAEKQTPISTADAADTNTETATKPTSTSNTESSPEQERSEKILKAKELYSHGSRDFLVKNYSEAADELSEVCTLYEELYGELSDELGMPYLLYAKSLIALALDENKVIDVPDVEDDDDDDDDEDDDDGAAATTDKDDDNSKEASSTKAANGKANDEEKKTNIENIKKAQDETEVSSSGNGNGNGTSDNNESCIKDATTEKKNNHKTAIIADDEKPGTSNGAQPETSNGETPGSSMIPIVEEVEDEEDNDQASTLQLAWEILELAAKIFSRQGISGLPNLAEVHTELGNIQFENNILDVAREDYEKALKIYNDLSGNYRRPRAEIHYKIGLTYLMQQLNNEGAAAFKDACHMIDGEIEEIKSKSELTNKDEYLIQDMEETKQEILAKIIEIEETQAQNVAEVRAALDSYIKPITSHQTVADDNDDDAGASSSSARACTSGASAATLSSSTASSSTSASAQSKPTDISHLIKRKKPDDASTESETNPSPAKRPTV